MSSEGHLSVEQFSMNRPPFRRSFPKKGSLRHFASQFRRETLRLRNSQLVCSLFTLLFLVQVSAGAPAKPVKRVLILNEVGASSPGLRIIDNGIMTALQDSPYHIQFYIEYMDSVLFPEAADQKKFRDFYIAKYAKRKPDVIVTVGPTPLQFMIDAHREFFPGIPIVFCLLNGAPRPLDAEFTGVDDTIAALETLRAALRLVPGTEHVVVTGGVSAWDRQEEAVIKEAVKPYEQRLDISYLTELSLPDLLERVSHLPDHTIVLMATLTEDGVGTLYVSAAESGPMVAKASNVPVFSFFDPFLNHGIVGGDLSDFDKQGRAAGSTTLKLLNGERPQDIPIVKDVTTYVFDWKALERWGMKESNLPPGSVVINRQPTVWEEYTWYIAGGLSLIVVEALLIFALLWHRAKRRRANLALQAREELLKIFVKNVPAGVAMLDRDMRYLQVSDRWCADYGADVSQILGRSHYEAFPDIPDRWREMHRRALNGETLRADEDRWDRESGTAWLQWAVRPWLNSDGVTGGILIFAEDITRRKQADQALAGMTRKLIESQEQERTRIARELHDDINQQLALLAVELDQSDQDGSTKDLQGAKRRVMEIAADVQALSHRLHSSKLEYLGLAAAAKSFCREISEMHHVRIDFTQNGVPRNLPEEVALCLFRVLQEALQNAVKYSGADHFEVDLYGASTDVQLRVRDFGQGFDVDDAVKTEGLGLVSMRERVNLVKGEIAIKSKPMCGTEITVHIPIRIADCLSEVTSGAA